MKIEIKSVPFGIVLLGVVRTAPNTNTWTFLNPGESWAQFPITDRGSFGVRVHLS